MSGVFEKLKKGLLMFAMVLGAFAFFTVVSNDKAYAGKDWEKEIEGLSDDDEVEVTYTPEKEGCSCKDPEIIKKKMKVSDLKKLEAEEIIDVKPVNKETTTTEAGVVDEKTEATEKEDTEAVTEESGDEYPEEIHLEGIEYTGEGEGADAKYKITVVLSPDAVKKGRNLGDIWAKVGGGQLTMDSWDGINTYDESGNEEDLPNGGKRVTWTTAIYFTGNAPKKGDEVVIGANAAGQDENGNWSEGEITNTQTIKWQE